MSAQADPPPWTGPWADDARRLFQLLQTATERLAEPPAAGAEPSADAAGPSVDADDPAAGHQHPPECRYCPFCQGVALLRRAGPDVLDQVAELAAGLAATLRATQPPPEPGGPGETPHGDPAAGPSEARASGPVRPPSTVRIDVTD